MLTCTKENPWDRSDKSGARVQHPDAVEGEQRDGWPSGDTVDYRCPNCGLKFTVELPQ